MELLFSINASGILMGTTLDMVVKKNLHCVKMPKVGDNEIVFCYQFCHYRFWFDKMVFSIRSISYNDVLHSQLMYFPIIFINTQKIIMTNFLFDLIDYPSYSFIYIPYQYSDHQSLECHLISISTGTIYKVLMTQAITDFILVFTSIRNDV